MAYDRIVILGTVGAGIFPDLQLHDTRIDFIIGRVETVTVCAILVRLRMTDLTLELGTGAGHVGLMVRVPPGCSVAVLATGHRFDLVAVVVMIAIGETIAVDLLFGVTELAFVAAGAVNVRLVAFDFTLVVRADAAAVACRALFVHVG